MTAAVAVGSLRERRLHPQRPSVERYGQLRAWALVACLTACAGAPPPEADGANGAARRSPQGALWPDARARAEAAPGWVVLRPPRARLEAERVVQAFFDAVRRESVGELSRWLSEDATISSGPGTTPESIPKVWGARFKQLDYGFSGAKQPFRSDDVGLFTADELAGLAPERRFALAPEADEVLAVVTTRDRRRAQGPRHFGKRLEFVLGPTPDGYRIRRMYEDFKLP